MKRSVSIILSLILTTVIAVCAMGCGNTGAPSETASYRVSVDGGSGSGRYYDGAVCTVTAEIPDGKQFIKWIKNGQEASVNAEFAFNVREDSRLIAVFADVPDNAGKDVCVIRVNDGIGGGGYIKGETCTVDIFTADKERDFAGWVRIVDGAETDIVSTDKKYTFDVTENIELKAKFLNYLLKTPDNSRDQMFGLFPGQAYILFDRQIDAETGETYTAFSEGVAYILLWVYTSPADDALPIGAFKLVSETDENGLSHGYICTMNYNAEQGLGRHIDFGGEPGAYYTPDGNTHNMLKAGIGEMSAGPYSSTTAYYFATQAIGIVVENGEMIYVDSPISGKGSGIINM